MGMFDNFIGTCPFCGEKFSCQTKISECALVTYNIGSKISSMNPTFNLQLKEECTHCGNFPIAVIKNGVVTAYITCGATHIERQFGYVEEV